MGKHPRNVAARGIADVDFRQDMPRDITEGLCVTGPTEKSIGKTLWALSG